LKGFGLDLSAIVRARTGSSSTAGRRAGGSTTCCGWAARRSFSLAFEEDPQRCRPALATLRELRDRLRPRLGEGHLSMGLEGGVAARGPVRRAGSRGRRRLNHSGPRMAPSTPSNPITWRTARSSASTV
jgi:hypothetical protein